MLDHFAEHFASWSIRWSQLIPVAVLGASLLGSGHCMAMCGGLITTVAAGKRQIFSYHLGRLVGYCTLGAIAGLLGETTFQSKTFSFVPWISTFVLAAGFIYLGIQLWQGRSLHLFRIPEKVWRKFVGYGPSVTGLFSAFLPCGWLHTFVLGAVATQSPISGALYLFFFWLGTLPALSIAPLATTRILQPLAKRAPRASALILILIGISSLGIKMFPYLTPNSPVEHTHHCHH